MSDLPLAEHPNASILATQYHTSAIGNEHYQRRKSVTRPSRKKLVGAALVGAALLLAGAGWTWASAAGPVSTDNAYVRGDITSLAPKVGGYVTVLEVEDNQAVRAGDVLFRIDDRDYRARLAQADASVAAAEARLINAAEDILLQQTLVRQAEAQRRVAAADLELAVKAVPVL